MAKKKDQVIEVSNSVTSDNEQVEKIKDIATVMVRGKNGRFQKADPSAVLSNPSINNVQILSGKIKDMFLRYSYIVGEGPTEGDLINRSGQNIVHHDMITSYNRLGVHLALVCEEITLSEEADLSEVRTFDQEVHDIGSINEKVSRFSVEGFKIEGDDTKEGVVLYGSKRLSTRQVVRLETPKILWHGAYNFVHDLRADIDHLKAEVLQYMNGKMYVAPAEDEDPNQIEMDFSE